jgi:hypothetical protein
MEPSTTTPTSPLAEYLVTQFDQYTQNRKPLVTKWNTNRAAFRRISEDFWKTAEAEDPQSDKIFIGLIRSKVIYAAALVLDVALQGGKLRYDLLPISRSFFAALSEDPGMAVPDMQAIVEAFHSLIDEQLVDGQVDRSFMKCVFSAALYGECFGKFVTSDVTKTGFEPTDAVPESGEALWNEYSLTETVPGWEYRPVWNMFRDLETDDIQAGHGIYDAIQVSPFWLWQRRNRDHFLTEETLLAVADLRKALDERVGTGTVKPQSAPAADVSGLPPVCRDMTYRRNVGTFAEYWGMAPTVLVEHFERNLSPTGAAQTSEPLEMTQDTPPDETEIMAGIVANRIVRFARRPQRKRPFIRAIWQDALDEVAPISVADNLETAQFLLNGAARSFFRNKKFSGNVMGAVKQELILNDPQVVYEGKLLNVDPSCDDARKAFLGITIPDVGETLMSMINLLMQLAEEESLLPKLLQGLSESSSRPETALEVSRRAEQAGKYIASVLRNMDEGLVEPMVEAIYEYDMLNPDLKLQKANVRIRATGHAGYQERTSRVMKLAGIINVVGKVPGCLEQLQPRRTMDSLFKASDDDPKNYMKTMEELQAEAAPPADQPPGPGEEAELALREADTRKREAEAEHIAAKTRGEQAKTAKEILSADRPVHR